MADALVVGSSLGDSAIVGLAETSAVGSVCSPALGVTVAGVAQAALPTTKTKKDQRAEDIRHARARALHRLSLPAARPGGQSAPAAGTASVGGTSSSRQRARRRARAPRSGAPRAMTIAALPIARNAS